MVDCNDCDGDGDVEGDISDIKLEPHMHNYSELVELQRDAKRVIKQAAKLCELRPERQESYDAQLRATIWIINQQAERASKK